MRYFFCTEVFSTMLFIKVNKDCTKQTRKMEAINIVRKKDTECPARFEIHINKKIK